MWTEAHFLAAYTVPPGLRRGGADSIPQRQISEMLYFAIRVSMSAV